MDLWEKVAAFVLTWTALSLIVAADWSRFMVQVHRKEQQLHAVSQRRARRNRRTQVRLARSA
jgi:hypothetical protein